jgi:hypothetical protein
VLLYEVENTSVHSQNKIHQYQGEIYVFQTHGGREVFISIFPFLILCLENNQYDKINSFGMDYRKKNKKCSQTIWLFKWSASNDLSLSSNFLVVYILEAIIFILFFFYWFISTSNHQSYKNDMNVHYPNIFSSTLGTETIKGLRPLFAG